MDVRHTAVTQFQRVPIKDFVQGVTRREAIIYGLKEFMPNVSGNIESWIQLYYIFVSRSLRFKGSHRPDVICQRHAIFRFLKANKTINGKKFD